MIELDNTFWFIPDDKGITDINDPFSGLLTEHKLPRLIRDYETWCIDMRLCALREGKAIGSSKAQTGMRDSTFQSRLISSPNYQRNLRTQKTQGKKQLAGLIKEAKRELRMMIRNYRNGDLSFNALRKDSANFFEHFYKHIWNTGRKASGLTLYVPEAKPTKKEIEWLNSSVNEELKFWQSFMEEIKKGEVLFADETNASQLALNPPRRRYTVEERLNMYLAGLDAVFENGRVSGMPSTMLYYWYGPKKGDRGLCKGCEYIIERQPFTKGNLPAVPRSGSTPCLTNCRHKLVVRKASLHEVNSRKNKLPSRTIMARQLADIKEGGAKYRVHSRLTNPWKKY